MINPLELAGNNNIPTLNGVAHGFVLTNGLISATTTSTPPQTGQTVTVKKGKRKNR